VTHETVILRALHAAHGGYVHASAIAADLAVEPGAVVRVVRDLEALGFVIESHPHHGLRLLISPDRILADDLKARISTRSIGRMIRVFAETDSTNDLAQQFAGQGAEEGLVVFADAQRRGRGRQGRSWVSPPGCGLYFSVLLRPSLPAAQIPLLTLAAAAAVAESSRELHALSASIKWPNDVRIRGRKAAGILTETMSERGRIGYVVLGVGINVNPLPESLPEHLHQEATSLAAAKGGRAIHRPELAAAVLQRLDDLISTSARTGWGALMPRFEALCDTVGATVSIRNGARTIEGDAIGLDDQGSLRIRTPEGCVETVHSGDVREVRYGLR
jgi:BirA family biotin operon repressor/biotin-[acetyl-CoA-carboxylase] ligase